MSEFVTCPQLGRIGRLGNQLWQIASTLGIARRRGLGVSLPANWPYRPFFSVPDAAFEDRLGPPAHTLPEVDHILPRYRDYLQDFGLWRDHAPEVREWFRPSPRAREVTGAVEAFKALRRPVVSLHVRRGDNLSINPLGYHPVRPLSYYREGLRRTGPAGSLAVFSDDIAWCRTVFQGADLFYEGRVRANENEPAYATDPVLDWVDLLLMAACDRHVISNSSYAWWGAWLSHDAAPVYPWPWYGPHHQDCDAGLMFPPGWDRVDHGPIDEPAARRD
jgi:hypothetical protein